MRALGLASIGCALLAGCGSGEDARSGANEPIRVSSGQFVQGTLVGGTDGPTLVTLESSQPLVVPGSSHKYSGTAAAGSTSVALALEGLGSGYWVVPVGLPTGLAEDQGAVTWSATVDYARDLPEGARQIMAVASDVEGRHGPLKSTRAVITDSVPGGQLAISLSWDANADLDLHVIGPSSKELDPKNPNTGLITDAGVAAGSGQLDRDSNGGCVIDAIRRENVIWAADAGAPEKGPYWVRVDMFDACGQLATDFAVQLWQSGSLVKTQTGRLLDVNASGGGPGAGLFVMDFVVQ